MAQMAEPVQRTVGGRVRYVACLRYADKQSDGTYREPRERAIVFVNGRLDRIIDQCRRGMCRRGLRAVPGPGKDAAIEGNETDHDFGEP